MRIRIWNAFASNNSGSYVIVGTFRSQELAAEVAAEFLDVCQTHTAWLTLSDAEKAMQADVRSPLALLAERHGITRKVEDDRLDDAWPEYSGRSHPAAWATGHQVFVHSDYTVGMPTLFGHVMYVRGGRVSTELDHAHHSIVALFQVWFPLVASETVDISARVRDIVDDLSIEGGVFSKCSAECPPAWRGVVDASRNHFFESHLEIGAVFDDLAEGFAGVEAVVEAHGAAVRVDVFEAREGQDPLAFLRPSVPRPQASIVDVVLDSSVAGRTGVVRTLIELGVVHETAVIEELTGAITVLGKGMSLRNAKDLRARLEELGVRAKLRDV